MSNTDAEIISDKYRSPIVIQRRADGNYFVRGPRAWLILSVDEIRRIAAFAEDRPHIQRYPAS